MVSFSLSAQENAVVLQRTPEQEASKQTDKLQQELNLNTDQAKQIYEINLRYARERQISNKRSEALERMKNKNAEIQQILSQEQNEKLQLKRYERTNTESVNGFHSQSVNPPSFRSNTENRPSSPTVRVMSGDAPVRSSFRPSTPTSQGQQNSQQPQAVKRSLPVEQQSQPPRTSVPQSVRPQTTVPAQTTPRRTDPTPSSNGRR